MVTGDLICSGKKSSRKEGSISFTPPLKKHISGLEIVAEARPARRRSEEEINTLFSYREA